MYIFIHIYNISIAVPWVNSWPGYTTNAILKNSSLGLFVIKQELKSEKYSLKMKKLVYTRRLIIPCVADTVLTGL